MLILISLFMTVYPLFAIPIIATIEIEAVRLQIIVSPYQITNISGCPIEYIISNQIETVSGILYSKFDNRNTIAYNLENATITIELLI